MWMTPQQKQGDEAKDGVDPRTGPRQWIMGRDAFERRMPHHAGIKALWETKWKVPCQNSVYPFHDGAFRDFEPVFDLLIKANVNDPTDPAYTLAFIPPADRLAMEGDLAVAADKPKEANRLYLRACALYRIARFPYITAFPEINDPVKWRAWEAQKRTYLKAGALWQGSPLTEVLVPHRHAAGRDRAEIPVYVRVPTNAAVPSTKKEGGGVPAVILMTGLDGYRPDNTLRSDKFTEMGWASIIVEIPGTADCPADSADPKSPDRLWTSLLEWISEDGRFDTGRIMVWGLSCGGYYAVRVAHTHRQWLLGCVAQGAGTHYFFDREWLEKVDGHEYPFELTPSLAMKYGYDSVEEFKANAQKKFSLLENKVLQNQCIRLLLANGTFDGLMPIEDSLILFEFGMPKEARFMSGRQHMGYPDINYFIYKWMTDVMELGQNTILQDLLYNPNDDINVPLVRKDII